MSEVPFNQKRLVAVEYPAVVRDANKMLHTLGGEDRIAETFSDPSHRLELKFRPDDVFCKPAFGDRHNTTNLLMKVIKRKSANGETICKVEILGIVDTTYRFQSLVDYQYLPMRKKDDGCYESLEKKLSPQKLESTSWLADPVPMWLPPPIFARMDSPGDYQFRREPQRRDNILSTLAASKPPNIISRTRLRRTIFAQVANFDDKEMPTQTHESSLKQLKLKFCTEEMVQVVQKLFEKRPIWSRNALLAQPNVARDKLKIILPSIAYYFLNGPWRGLWIRLGYDPRKDPEARIYQFVDFRARQSGAAKHMMIGSKRGSFNYILPNKVSQNMARIATIQTETLATESSGSITEKEEDQLIKLESTYRFHPDILPPFRQMFYQYCDVDVPSIQDLLSKKSKQEVCHERHGWLEPNVQTECRYILTNYVQTLCEKLKAENQTPNTETVESEESDQSNGGSDMENEMATELLDYVETEMD